MERLHDKEGLIRVQAVYALSRMQVSYHRIEEGDIEDIIMGFFSRLKKVLVRSSRNF
jgi:hypothetical protein